MAAFGGVATTGEVALTDTNPHTVLQLVAAANHRVKILGWGVYFDGIVTTAAPVIVRLLRQTSAGTMSSLTDVRKKDDSIADSLLTTAQHTATAEPTAGDLLKRIEVHPQQGYEYTAPYGGEMIVGGGDRVGIECTAGATVNVVAWIDFEE